MGFIGDIFSGDEGSGWDPSKLPVKNPEISNPFEQAPLKDAQADSDKIAADQAAFAKTLLDRSQGLGPNPAQGALQQATNQNQAMTAGTIASTKGIDPALAARQAAMAGSNIQQNSAAQGAQMQAGQQIAAGNALGGLYGQMGTQGLQQQGILQGALDSYVKNQIANEAQANSAKSGVAAANAGTQGGILKGITSGIGGAIGLAKGGTVPASFGDYMSGTPMAKGGAVPALVSPGERYLAPDDVKAVADGKKSALGAGEKIPGNPKVGGSKDSYANDTVEKTLETGGIVLPRSVTNAENPSDAAAKFVQAILARKGRRK